MTRVADLGWQLARCNMASGEEELELMEPESETNEAKSMRITGREAILALRDLIDDCIVDWSAQEAEAKTVPRGIDNGSTIA